MKKLIFTFILLTSHFTYAKGGPGDGYGDGGGVALSIIKTHEVVALTTKDGEYARIQDLRDGFIKFDGVKIIDDKIILDLNNPKFNLESIVK